MKGETFGDDSFCQHDVDLERFLDLRNGVTRELRVHEGQRGKSFVADVRECLCVSRKVGGEIWVAYSNSTAISVSQVKIYNSSLGSRAARAGDGGQGSNGRLPTTIFAELSRWN